MFHKRLLKEFNDNIKYVVGMVATQWVSLLANVGMMLTVAVFVANLVMVSFVTAGTSLPTKTQINVSEMIKLLIVFAIAFLVRVIATTINTKQSFAASENVKIRLREKVYPVFEYSTQMNCFMLDLRISNSMNDED